MKLLANRKLIGALAALGGLITALTVLTPANAGAPLGDIECVKTVNGASSGTTVEPETDVTFEVECDVIALATVGTVQTEELEIVDVIFTNFDIESATCAEGNGATFDPATAAVVNGQEATCDSVPNEVDDRLRLTIVGQFVDGPCGPYNNAATGTYDADVETPGAIFTLECEDLIADKVASSSTDSTGATVNQGGTITYTITICNDDAGGGDAEGVRVTDQLPTALTSANAVSQDFTLAPGGAGQIVATLALLAPGECAELSITATVATNATCGLVLTNTVTAVSTTGSTFDADPSNNVDSTSTSVTCPASQPGGTPTPGGGAGPAVGTGDSGVAGSGSVEPWELAILGIGLLGTLTAGTLAARRLF
jgi:uncharacterized repeat protein (TIGR01451 family)